MLTPLNNNVPKFATIELTAQEAIMNRLELKNIITALEVKTITPVSANVRDEEIVRMIVVAQEVYIYDILGCKLYEELITELVLVDFDYNKLPDASISTTGVDYRTLYDFVAKALAWHTIHNLAISLTNPLTEKGIQNKNSDFSTSADLSAMKYIASSYMDKANIYGNRLRYFILRNYGKREEYVEQQGVNGTKPLYFYDARSIRKNPCKSNKCI